MQIKQISPELILSDLSQNAAWTKADILNLTQQPQEQR